MSVHKKLMEARTKLQSTPLKKTGWNTYSEFHYFEMSDFLPAIQTIFKELGLCGVVSCTDQLATLTITDTEDGTCLVITSPFGSAKLKASHEVQNIGACITYHRRYLWMTALEIVERDALDATLGKEKAEETKKPNTPTQIKVDAFDQMSPEAQSRVVDMAQAVKDELDAGNVERAYEIRMGYTFDNEFVQAAFFSQFNPKQTKMLKDEADRLRKAATQERKAA